MRVKFIFSYDGSKFEGFQKQRHGKTVQDAIERVLFMINREESVSLVGSGRTDSGVHALAQTAHADIRDMDVNVLRYSMNRMLKPFISVHDISAVDEDFHARFSAKRREYVYKINIGEYNVFEVDYVNQLCRKLSVDKMQSCLKYFIGTHDFAVFSKLTTGSTVRIIYDISITVDNDILSINIIGSGFLRRMVRGIVGVLIDIGLGANYDLGEIFNTQDCSLVASFAIPNGLYLKSVEYD